MTIQIGRTQMDPNAALWNILTKAQDLGHPMTIGDSLDKLDEIIETATDLRAWVRSGGFQPEVNVVVMTDEQYIADVKAGWDDTDQVLDI